MDNKSVANILTYEYLYNAKQKGLALKEIAIETGCSIAVISKYRRKYKLATPPKVTKDSNVSHILTYDYLKSVHEIMEVSEIAKDSGCGRSTVRKYLHKYGLSLKDSRKGKYVGERNNKWKGGRYTKPNGYVMVRVAPGEYQREHILVMENYIGRKLYRDEVVHHIDGNPSNNDINNLILLTKIEHDRYHMICRNKGVDYRIHKREDILQLLGITENVRRPGLEMTSRIPEKGMGETSRSRG